MSQSQWVVVGCGGNLSDVEAEMLLAGELSLVPSPCIGRPACSCCGYPAPLPTLRQFDGLCLGCSEEREEDQGCSHEMTYRTCPICNPELDAAMEFCDPLYGYEPCAGCNKPCQNGVCAACEVLD